MLKNKITVDSFLGNVRVLLVLLLMDDVILSSGKEKLEKLNS